MLCRIFGAYSGSFRLNIKLRMTTKMAYDSGSHSGANTHSQDQLMTAHNLNIVNTAKRKAKKPAPMPEGTLLLLFSIVVTFNKYNVWLMPDSDWHIADAAALFAC